MMATSALLTLAFLKRKIRNLNKEEILFWKHDKVEEVNPKQSQDMDSAKM